MQETVGEHTRADGMPTAGYGGTAVGPGGQIGRYRLLRIPGEGGDFLAYSTLRQQVKCQIQKL